MEFLSCASTCADVAILSGILRRAVWPHASLSAKGHLDLGMAFQHAD